MKASVIICTYNRAKLLTESIQSIMEQDFPSDQFELIIVDNNSTDDTKNIVDELASSSKVKIKYVFEEKQGHSHARNTGIKNADGEIIVFTDDDVEAEKTWLREITSAFDNPDVACAGGPIRPIWLAEKPDWLTEGLQNYLAISEFRFAQENGEFKGPNYPWGANIAFLKEVFQTVGGFSTNLGRVGTRLLTSDEIELCRKIEASGKRIRFAPNAVVHHKVLPERLKKSWFYHRSYWQGRSDTILDLNVNANVYTRLRQYAAEFVWRETEAKENDFENKCFERLVTGYLHQLLFPEKEESNLREIRVLGTFLSEVIKISTQKIGEKNNKINELVRYIDEKHSDLKKYDELLKEKDKVLREKDEQIKKHGFFKLRE